MFFCGISDIGRKRVSNQDSFNITELDGALLCTVCDGMGGANGGNVASELAVKVYTNFICDCLSGRKDAPDHVNLRSILSDAVSAANGTVYRRAESDFTLSGMGTTLVSALLLGSTLYAVNVGDSRLYMISNGGIKQVTHDHSYVQCLIDIGKLTPEEAATAPMKNIITRSVGCESRIKADIFTEELNGSGYLLLCSDGLTNYVTEAQILNTVTGFSDGTTDLPFEEAVSGGEALAERAKRLIGLANEAGGGDNITVVLVRF